MEGGKEGGGRVFWVEEREGLCWEAFFLGMGEILISTGSDIFHVKVGSHIQRENIILPGENFFGCCSDGVRSICIKFSVLQFNVPDFFARVQKFLREFI